MEEREGTIVSYDNSAKTAVVTDTYTGGNISATNVGNIGAGNPLPAGAIITYISVYIPPRGTEAAKIVNIIKEIKN